MSSQAAIVIADACPLFRWSVRQFLGDRYHVAEAASGSEALVALGSAMYDVLISGCGCRDLTCSELVAQCKQLQPGIQILLLLDFPFRIKDCDCCPSDVRCWYEKPVDLAELSRKIDQIVGTAEACHPSDPETIEIPNSLSN